MTGDISEMADLPNTDNALIDLQDGVLHFTFNRPKARNAMSLGLLGDIQNTFEAIADDRSIRAVVLRGADGNFCAGGDIKDMANARQSMKTQHSDPVIDYSRAFGTMLRAVNKAPQAVIAVLEGAVLGGGFGLCCVSDVAIARPDAKFGLPETGLGLPPAQIAPFVVERIGITQARRLGVCGGRFGGDEALRLGLVHFVSDKPDDMVNDVINQVRRCAPNANAVTKQIMLSVARADLDDLLDDAARDFADCLRSDEGTEGTMAFIEKRKPFWAATGDD